jgi:hypothetical protein
MNCDNYNLFICRQKIKNKYSAIDGIIAYAISEDTIRIFVSNVDASKDFPSDFAGKNIVIITVSSK